MFSNSIRVAPQIDENRSVTRRTVWLFLFLAALSLVRPFAAAPGTTANAHPGFDGIWNSATATPLERPLPLKDKAFFTPEEARSGNAGSQKAMREPPPQTVSDTGTGTYNTVYREFGSRIVKTPPHLDHHRPPDGRIPALTPEAADVKRRRLDAMKTRESAQDTGLQDQCLAFLTAGPPMLPYSYNSNYQIMQTKDAFVVHAEMIHDARIIRLDGRPHLPPRSGCGWAIRSVGGRAPRSSSTRRTSTTRRLLRRRGRQLRLGPESSRRRAVQPARRRHAALPVRDRQPHGLHATLEGELTMARSPGPIYEYACHEGNYALSNLLRDTASRNARPPTRRCAEWWRRDRCGLRFSDR
jgi:hypothetical protein